MGSSDSEGLCFVCRSRGTIRKILHDGIGIPNCREEDLFMMMAATEDSAKALDFFDELKSEGAAFDWPLQVKTEQGPVPLVFSGTRVEGDYLIVAFFSNSLGEELLDGLMKVNNEQMNSLRRQVKDRSAVRTGEEKQQEG